MSKPTQRCMAATLLAWVAAFLYAGTYTYEVERTLWLCRITGYISLVLLFASLSITPIRRIASRIGLSCIKIAPYRRSLGITAFGSALTHAALSCIRYFGDAPWFMPLLEPFLRFGVLTLAILAALWLTSFPKWIRWMHLRTWRELHWLAYSAALTALLHVLLSPFAPVREILLAALVWLVFAMLRLVPRKS